MKKGVGNRGVGVHIKEEKKKMREPCGEGNV